MGLNSAIEKAHVIPQTNRTFNSFLI